MASASLNKSSATETEQDQERADYLHKHALSLTEQLSEDLFFSIRV